MLAALLYVISNKKDITSGFSWPPGGLWARNHTQVPMLPSPSCSSCPLTWVSPDIVLSSTLPSAGSGCPCFSRGVREGALDEAQHTSLSWPFTFDGITVFRRMLSVERQDNIGFRIKVRLPSPKSLTTYLRLECYCHLRVGYIYRLRFIWQLITLRVMCPAFPGKPHLPQEAPCVQMPHCSSSYRQWNQNSGFIPPHSLFLISHAHSP